MISSAVCTKYSFFAFLYRVVWFFFYYILDTQPILCICPHGVLMFGSCLGRFIWSHKSMAMLHHSCSLPALEPILTLYKWEMPRGVGVTNSPWNISGRSIHKHLFFLKFYHPSTKRKSRIYKSVVTMLFHNN